ncbi:MAG: beta-ketoacyl-[acyl-carrier-protein] synthase family protein [Candidatus Omnitrophica bacterium]|nr:beta-ketoacyl-[acyl-carrier-protein] synthase family protein [Candidatus Omnitrophota bacterium]
MDNLRVVVTGLGVISPNSAPGRDSFKEAVFGGFSGIKPISLFDTSSFNSKLAGEIKDFDPGLILGREGLRVLDRSAKLLCCATQLALEDAKFKIDEENCRDVGIAIGNTLGSVQGICDFDKVAINEGPQYVNPSFFPNTVINAQVSQTSIKFKIKGFNVTISNGFSSGIDSIAYAANFIRSGRKSVVLAGGVEELSLHNFLGFYKTGLLSKQNQGAVELSCPFDKRRNGVIFSEGAVVLVLESLESALRRKAVIYAEIKGSASFFNTLSSGRCEVSGDSLKKAMRLAINKSGIDSNDVDCVMAGANSTQEFDKYEADSINDVFGKNSLVKVSAIKSMLGESFSASGAFQSACALLAIENQMVPPTINYQEKDSLCDLGIVSDKAVECSLNNVLVNAFGPNSGNSSLIISKYAG